MGGGECGEGDRDIEVAYPDDGVGELPSETEADGSGELPLLFAINWRCDGTLLWVAGDRDRGRGSSLGDEREWERDWWSSFGDGGERGRD